MPTFDQSPVEDNVTVYAGNNLTLPYQLLQQVTANNITSNVPVNITGYGFEAGLTINGVTVTGNVAILNAANGSIAVLYTREQIGTLTTGVGVHYLDVIDTTPYQRTYVYGQAELRAKK